MEELGEILVKIPVPGIITFCKGTSLENFFEITSHGIEDTEILQGVYVVFVSFTMKH